MFDAGMTLDVLRECLDAIEPVELLGMRLLKQCSEQAHSHAGFHPMTSSIPREALTQAVSEIVDYIGRCASVARRLSDLAPIPLMTVEIFEFGL